MARKKIPKHLIVQVLQALPSDIVNTVVRYTRREFAGTHVLKPNVQLSRVALAESAGALSKARLLKLLRLANSPQRAHQFMV